MAWSYQTSLPSDLLPNSHIIFSSELSPIDVLLEDSTTYILISSPCYNVTSLAKLPVKPIVCVLEGLNSLELQKKLIVISLPMIVVKSEKLFCEMVSNQAKNELAKAQFTSTPKDVTPAQVQMAVKVIPKIGEKNVTALLVKFGSLHNICNANLGQLGEVLSETNAMHVYQFFNCNSWHSSYDLFVFVLCCQVNYLLTFFKLRVYIIWLNKYPIYNIIVSLRTITICTLQVTIYNIYCLLFIIHYSWHSTV